MAIIMDARLVRLFRAAIKEVFEVFSAKKIIQIDGSLKFCITQFIACTMV